eukprot:TRINITY_DN55738_c0_g1_i1.p1 TRINITY_DN55738_c0_g1~~TRINITY_DN55738_c0_g1_i1.p1  ORF type:complete len:128 (+),score=49.78 TRINITY_DN55738_c0_g1_i1:108-491(+)
MKLVPLFLLALLLVSTGKGHMVSKRQAEETRPGSFHLFGQVFGSLVRLFGTVVEEGGNFLAKQAEANEPVLETVGNISSTIGRSDFVQGVTGGAGTVVRGTSCLLMCSITPQGELRRRCEERNCQTV